MLTIQPSSNIIIIIVLCENPIEREECSDFASYNLED